MTLNILHINDVYTVYVFKVSFTLVLCLVR